MTNCKKADVFYFQVYFCNGDKENASAVKKLEEWTQNLKKCNAEEDGIESDLDIVLGVFKYKDYLTPNEKQGLLSELRSKNNAICWGNGEITFNKERKKISELGPDIGIQNKMYDGFNVWLPPQLVDGKGKRVKYFGEKFDQDRLECKGEFVEGRDFDNKVQVVYCSTARSQEVDDILELKNASPYTLLGKFRLYGPWAIWVTVASAAVIVGIVFLARCCYCQSYDVKSNA